MKILIADVYNLCEKFFGRGNRVRFEMFPIGTNFFSATRCHSLLAFLTPKNLLIQIAKNMELSISLESEGEGSEYTWELKHFLFPAWTWVIKTVLMGITDLLQTKLQSEEIYFSSDLKKKSNKKHEKIPH